MMDVIRDAWPWVLLAYLLGLLCGWLVTRLYYRDRLATLERELQKSRSSSAAGFVSASTLTAENPSSRPTIPGERIRLNDLEVIEGIGPKIARLLNDDGIVTWADLATAQVARLERILDTAGHDYQMHVPGTWPRQAKLLAEGRWQEFKDLTDELQGGR